MSQPAMSERVRERRIGVDASWPSITLAAARTSSSVTGSGLIMDIQPRNTDGRPYATADVYFESDGSASAINGSSSDRCSCSFLRKAPVAAREIAARIRGGRATQQTIVQP